MRALLFLPLFVVSGCTVGPDYARPTVEVSDAWQMAVEGELSEVDPDIASWWRSLEDPVLTDLIRRAELSSLDLLIAVARITEAQAVHGIRSGALYPGVSLDGGYTRSKPSENSATGRSITSAGGSVRASGEWSARAAAAWEIDVFGRIRRQVESAEAQYEASIEDYRDVQVMLFAEVAIQYIDVRALQQRLAHAHANAEAQRESVKLTTDRFDAGLTSALDVAQAEQNLAQTESSIPTFEAAQIVAENRLAVLLGLEAGALHDELADGDPTLPSAPDGIAVGVPAELLRRRPDLRRAERQLAAQTANIGVAKADLYPTFSIQGFVEAVAGSAGDLASSDSIGWGLLPGFRWDLFSGGAIRSNIEAEEARTEQALLAYRQTLLLAIEEVHGALVSLDRERERRDSLLGAVDASGRAVELVRTQYLSGLTNFQNLLDTQRSLFQQQDLLAESEGQVVQNLILLNRALGGGWSLDEETP
jgi:NodT family efflux transporter outer membrane factor (OMF) lipoprotein